VNILLYANSPKKARLLLPWVQGLSRHFATQVTAQTTREPGPGERAAAGIFKDELEPSENLRLDATRTEGEAPEEGIARTALTGDYNLVILAPAGRRGFIRLFYGSMVAKVVRKVSTSVMVVRAGAVPPRRILVCVSGSRHSLTNVRAAAQLAVIFGGSVTIMMVLSQLPVQFSDEADQAGSGKPGEGGAGWQEAFLKSDHSLAAHLRAARDLLHNLGARGGVRVVEGLVVDEILDELEAFDHDLLVLGTHRAEDYDPMYEDLTSEMVQKSTRTTLVVGLRADLL
jgi:nucleotide-binding universal stress UspA family protein